jgi:hypothetical protein
MEKTTIADEDTSLPSSGVEWTASIFALLLVAAFFTGLRRKKSRGGA